MKKLLLAAFLLFLVSQLLCLKPDGMNYSKSIKKPVKFCVSRPLGSKRMQTCNDHETEDYQNIWFHADPIGQPSTKLNPAVQERMGRLRQPPIVENFEGVPCIGNVSNPDTEGDVGREHYFQMVKRSFSIWDKEGNLLYGPAENKTIWDDLVGPWNDMTYTDPIVLYDHISDRWLASCMVYDIPNSYFEVIAVSTGPDPLGSWNCYAYEYANLPDYPKFGVWPDGYYMTINEAFITPSYEAIWEGLTVMVLNREDMMNGVAEPRTIVFDFVPVGDDMFEDLSCVLPADLDGILPQPQTPNFLACVKDDAWGYDDDSIWLWECSIDWADTLNCQMNEVAMLPTEHFDLGLDALDYIDQPGNTNQLVSMSDRLMHRLQYRNLDDYQAMVVCHAVKLNQPVHAGMRWYELRDEGNGWNLYQQGTYAPDDDSRWMGSVAMDSRGNIALGYSVSSNSVYPSIRFTGRRNHDLMGEMTIEEQEIIAGNGCQINNPRWGDYSSMSVDPEDDLTFWYTQQYIETTGQFVWQTRIASFILNTELTLSPDSLVFDTLEDCTLGKGVSVLNGSYEDLTIEDIDLEGYLEDAQWYIDPLGITLPYILESGDSIILNVKIDLPTQQLSENYLIDTLYVHTQEKDYSALIKLNDNLITDSANDLPGLEPNCSIHPNPFNPSTEIRFSLPIDSDVKIEIFNSRGQKIRRLLERGYLAGHHKIEWNGTNDYGSMLGSGIYFCKISINDKQQTLKCVLLK